MAISARYFDGHSAKAHDVELSLADGQLLINTSSFADVATSPPINLSIPVDQIQWPERTRHGTRTAHLPSGGTLDCADAQTWDDWRSANGHTDSFIVRVQQNWRWVGGSFAAFLLTLFVLVQWGVPAAASAIVPLVPPQIDDLVGQRVLAWADGNLTQPSQLPDEKQQHIVRAFEDALGSLSADTVPKFNIVFRKSRIGANALALPGGTIIVTDELVTAFGDDDDLYIGVLGHELGHLRQRHGMRAVVQVSAIGALVSVVVGDASSVLATAAAYLGQASYSRDAEREADAESVRVLKAARISPRVMVTAFAKLTAAHQNQKNSGSQNEQDSKPEPEDGAGNNAEKALGIAFASHPATTERQAFFETAAQTR
jgi:Zn-dependent protease with chaperone function